jgi:hypothetical protein
MAQDALAIDTALNAAEQKARLDLSYCFVHAATAGATKSQIMDQCKGPGIELLDVFDANQRDAQFSADLVMQLLNAATMPSDELAQAYPSCMHTTDPGWCVNMMEKARAATNRTRASIGMPPRGLPQSQCRPYSYQGGGQWIWTGCN